MTEKMRQGVYAERPQEPTTIYVKGGWPWWELIFGTVLGSTFLALLVYGAVFRPAGVRGTGNTVGFILVGVPVCLAVMTIGYGAVRRSLRYFRHRSQPALLLDADGLECAFGRISWRDVQSIELRGAGQAGREQTPGVIFRLLPGTEWQPVYTQYSEYLLLSRRESVEREGRLFLDTWKEPPIPQTLLRYYSGPIEFEDRGRKS